MDENTRLKMAVEESLRSVMDPEIGANIVDLGMIKRISIENQVATIEMTLTSPFCPLSRYLTSEVKKAAESVKGISRAEVKITGYGLQPP